MGKYGSTSPSPSPSPDGEGDVSTFSGGKAPLPLEGERACPELVEGGLGVRGKFVEEINMEFNICTKHEYFMYARATFYFMWNTPFALL